MWDTLLGGVIRAGFHMAGGDDLLSHPDSEGEGARTAAKHGVGAVVGLLEWQNGAAAVYPDEECVEKVSRQLVCFGSGNTRVLSGLWMEAEENQRDSCRGDTCT
jgi:hypothetical protein